MKLRLDKYLSNMGRGSRSDIKEDIRRGKVSVNGKNAKSGSLQIDSEKDVVLHDGEHVVYRPYLYLMLNKPVGYLSATEDRVHPTVIDLVPEIYRHYELFPVGRLDLDTTGLLLLTNDGAFSHRVTSPVSGIEKSYRARISRALSARECEQLLSGVEIVTKRGNFFCKAKEITTDESETKDNEENEIEANVRIVITEGKFHQVKKMFEAVGVEVLALARDRIGGLYLDGTLSPGEVRALSEGEILSIFASL